MKSLDTILSEAVSKMKPATRKKFAEQTRGERISQESLIAIAESLVAEDGAAVFQDWPVRDGRRITRNNGAQRDQVAESGSEEASEAVLLEGLAKARPQAFAPIIEAREAQGRLTAKQQEDFEFCKAIRMSEADALKVALSGGIRD